MGKITKACYVDTLLLQLLEGVVLMLPWQQHILCKSLQLATDVVASFKVLLENQKIYGTL